MKIEILGAHNSETATSKYISILVDGIFAIDAGGLTSSLPIEGQKRIKALLITHKHFDHSKDVVSLAINLFFQKASTDLYTTGDIYKALTDHLLNGVIYPNFFKIPEDDPSLRYHQIEPGKTAEIAGYRVLPVKMNHEQTTVGYQVTARDNKSIFYTADTGNGLSQVWQQISPQALFIEVTVSNSQTDFAVMTNHLTPEMVKKELDDFRKIKGYQPQVVALHLSPGREREIKAELAEVSKGLGIPIIVAHEGMRIQI